jgi:NAD(P)-dependent dehydrogenase (short-subunit alcohol dehydrogenase family)
MNTSGSRLVVLTGGSGGLGAAIARRVVAGGYRLVMTYRTPGSNAEATAATLRGHGADVTARQLDLEDLSAVEAFGQEIAARNPAISGLVNCAGRLDRGDLASTTAGDLLASFAVNCAAPVVLLRSLVAPLRAGRGAVVNVCSITAEVAGQDRIAYTASKAALVGVTRALALELAPDIRVNALLPGLFDTAMNLPLKHDAGKFAETTRRIPGGRLGRPDEFAGAVMFLLGDDATYLTGVALPVDGGVMARSPLPAGDSR